MLPTTSDKTYVRYYSGLKGKAHDLRLNSTFTERLLWSRLRGRQLLGFKFIRQKPIDTYIVDFYAPELKIIIELDGFSHNFKIDYDQNRQNCLEKLGFKILRFTDQEVAKNLNGVVEQIHNFIEDYFVVCEHPLFPPRGGG